MKKFAGWRMLKSSEFVHKGCHFVYVGPPHDYWNRYNVPGVKIVADYYFGKTKASAWHKEKKWRIYIRDGPPVATRLQLNASFSKPLPLP